MKTRFLLSVLMGVCMWGTAGCSGPWHIRPMADPPLEQTEKVVLMNGTSTPIATR